MAKRILNRKDLRADFDAAERTKEVDETEEDEEEEGDEDEEEEDEDGEEAGDAADEDEPSGDGDEDDEEARPKKKKKVVKPVKPKAKPRSRAAKVVRMRVVWGVFSNSNQCVATYEYPKREEANAHAAKLTADKRNTHFVQPVKEVIEEKKEEKKEKEK